MKVYDAVKKLLFLFEPETAHRIAINTCKFANLPLIREAVRRHFFYEDPALQVKAFGNVFPNPIGIAAGLDKNAEIPVALQSIGVGFVELGGVVPRPQMGNRKPRIFRYEEQEALINCMGLPSEGLGLFVYNLSRAKDALDIPIGVNIAKNTDTPIDKAVCDYVLCFEKIKELVDFVVVNVSCPNTEDSKQLQDSTRIKDILSAIQDINDRDVAILVKLSPDLTREQLEEIISCSLECNISGFTAVNTTKSRIGMPQRKYPNGGLSGKPLKPLALKTIKSIREIAGDGIPVVGVGGVSSVEDAWDMLLAGADLVQLYTGLVYKGPTLIRDIKKGLVNKLRENKFDNLSQISKNKACISEQTTLDKIKREKVVT